MKKVLAVSLLGAAFAFSPAVIAQQGVTLQGAEYDAYQSAEGQQDPAQKAQALETFLNTYPNTQVKASVLEELMVAYQLSRQPDKAVSAADRLLQVDPMNLRAIGTEVALKRAMALQKTPPDQTMLDQAAALAQKGLADTNKPASTDQATWDQLQSAFKPIFQDAIGVDDVQKKDYDNAIAALQAALAAYPADQATKAPALQDNYLLAQAYAGKGDTLSAAYYFARVNALAPGFTDAQKAAAYYYKKYHGADDGYDAFKQMAAQSVTLPADLSTKVTAGKKPQDYANDIVTSTTDYTTLNPTDVLFVLQFASQDNADKVFNTLKGKPGAFEGKVITATADTVQLAVQEESQQSNTADLTIKMKEPLKTVPTVNSTGTFIGTYDSYTRQPAFQVNAVDGMPNEKPKTPAKKPAPRRR